MPTQPHRLVGSEPLTDPSPVRSLGQAWTCGRCDLGWGRTSAVVAQRVRSPLLAVGRASVSGRRRVARTEGSSLCAGMAEGHTCHTEPTQPHPHRSLSRPHHTPMLHPRPAFGPTRRLRRRGPHCEGPQPLVTRNGDVDHASGQTGTQISTHGQRPREGASPRCRPLPQGRGPRWTGLRRRKHDRRQHGHARCRHS